MWWESTTRSSTYRVCENRYLVGSEVPPHRWRTDQWPDVRRATDLIRERIPHRGRPVHAPITNAGRILDRLADEVEFGHPRARERRPYARCRCWLRGPQRPRPAQFRSRKFLRALSRHYLVGSMVRAASCGDNAALESFLRPAAEERPRPALLGYCAPAVTTPAPMRAGSAPETNTRSASTAGCARRACTAATACGTYSSVMVNPAMWAATSRRV